MLAALAQYKMLEPLVAAKKARAIGVANMNASVLQYLLPRVSIPPAVNQAALSIAGHYVTGTPLRHYAITPLRHYVITSAAHSIAGRHATGLGGGNGDDTVKFCQ